MELFADGRVFVMDDYKSVSIHGSSHNGWSSNTIQKGQLEELHSLSKSLLNGEPWPISLEEQLLVSRISFEIEEKLLHS